MGDSEYSQFKCGWIVLQDKSSKSSKKEVLAALEECSGGRCGGGTNSETIDSIVGG